MKSLSASFIHLYYLYNNPIIHLNSFNSSIFFFNENRLDSFFPPKIENSDITD